MLLELSALPSHINLTVMVAAFLMSMFITRAIVKHPLTLGLDKPDGRRKAQTTPLPRLGGLPIFLTLIGGFAITAWRVEGFTERWWAVVLCNCLMFAIGFLDDLRPLGAKVKLLGQVGTASILYSLGISIDVLTNPFGDEHVFIGLWSFPITVLWLVAIPNIINLIDGMDGLAAGFGLFLSLTLAFVGHYAGRPEVVLMSVVMTGALGGFLFFNLPPARIYLGDGGAYLLGFYLASVSLFTANKGSIMAGMLVMLIALGVPILDTLFAILRRVIRGVPVFRADAEHIHHRLLTLGFSKAKALVAMYSVCLVLSLVGISILMSKGKALPIWGAACFLLMLGAVRYLGYIKRWSDVRLQFSSAMERRRDMLYTATYGKLLEWEAERSVNAEEFVQLLEVGATRAGLATKLAAGLETLELPLTKGRACRFYCEKMEGAHERSLAKADLFVPALNFALERWGALPRLEIRRVADSATNGGEASPPVT